jgi:protein-disulfide isomerase
MTLVRSKKMFPLSLLLAGAVAVACGLAPSSSTKAEAADAQTAAKAKVLATVNGQPITEADVESLAAEQLAQIEKQRQEIIEKALDGSIHNKLLDLEAAARGTTREALLDTEVRSKVAAPTEAEVDAFYEERKAQIGNRPKDQVAPQIQQYLVQQRQAEVYQKLIDGLRSKYKVENMLEAERVAAEVEKAKTLRSQVEVASAPAKGPASAPVQIVEFSDFQCPFCSRVVPALHQVVDKYKDKVRLAFRQFPLNSIHPLAQKAAEASLCANEQGKFWEMHDAMFGDQQGLAVDKLKEKAAALGLKADQFSSCLESGKMAAAVSADLQAGSAAGVSGTPAIFVNGRMLSGAQPFEALAKVIDEELKRAGSPVAR